MWLHSFWQQNQTCIALHTFSQKNIRYLWTSGKIFMIHCEGPIQSVFANKET